MTEKVAKIAKAERVENRSPEQQTRTIQQALDLAVQCHNAGQPLGTFSRATTRMQIISWRFW